MIRTHKKNMNSRDFDSATYEMSCIMGSSKSHTEIAQATKSLAPASET